MKIEIHRKGKLLISMEVPNVLHPSELEMVVITQRKIGIVKEVLSSAKKERSVPRTIDKPRAHIPQKEEVVFSRPKAEYTNKNHFDF